MLRIRIYILINIIINQIYCQTSEQPLELNTDLIPMSSESWQINTTENEFQLNTNYDTTIEQSLTTMITTESNFICSECITNDIIEKTKNEIIDKIISTISYKVEKKLKEIEIILSKLSCLNSPTSSIIKLSWKIYENLNIPLTGWLLVFDEPYSHRTRIDHLTQLSGICHNDIIVAATFNGSISVAAVGPSTILTLNTSWNQVQQFGQVYWYRTSGKSFGFSPLSNIRQTPADNEDLNSPLRLSWLLDQDIGGYRAGSIRSLNNDSIWHKVIYCN